MFPVPDGSSEKLDGISVVTLPVLVELKLVSGTSAPDRLQDLADVIELIRVQTLPKEFADDLEPALSAKYEELWDAAQLPKWDE